MDGGDDEKAGLDALEAMRALSEVLGSGVLSETSRQADILRYLITETVEGRGAALKAYSIGIDVLGRPVDFNPAADSIVRVEMNRLRKALALFNAVAKSGDVIIDIPKGQYQPRLIKVGAGRSGGDAEAASRWRRLAAAAVLTCAILAAIIVVPHIGKSVGSVGDEAAKSLKGIPVAVEVFETPASDADISAFADRLRQEMAATLSRNKALTVTMLPQPGVRSDAERKSAGSGALPGFFIEGSVWKIGGNVRFYLRLVDVQDGSLAWAQTFERSGESLAAEVPRLGADVAAELRTRIVTAAKRILEAKAPDALNAWELYVRATWVPGEAKSTLAWEKERVALAHRALDLDPNLGQAHSVLADKLAYLANVDPFSDKPELREEAERHARRALELSPDDADVVFNVSIHYWHAGRLNAAMRATQRVLELDPNHVLVRLHQVAIPYTCARPPDEVLQFVIQHDAALVPDNPVRWVTLTWISLLHINRGEFAQALVAARESNAIFHTPDTLLRLAVILHRLGRTDDAVRLIEEQRTNWPTLNPAHYATVTIPRRCGDQPLAAQIRELYESFAMAYAKRIG